MIYFLELIVMVCGILIYSNKSDEKKKIYYYNRWKVPSF